MSVSIFFEEIIGQIIFTFMLYFQLQSIVDIDYDVYIYEQTMLLLYMMISLNK